MPVYSMPPPASGIAEEVARVLDRVLEDHAVGVAAAAADEEAHRVHQRQRAARRSRAAPRLPGLPPSSGRCRRGCSSPRRGSPRRCWSNSSAVYSCGLDVGVLAGLARGLALVAGAGAERARDESRRAGCSSVASTYCSTRRPENLLSFTSTPTTRSIAVMRSPGRTWRNSLPVVAGVEAVHAGQAPARAADPAEGHREVRMREHRAVARQAAVLEIAVERVEIADAVAEVADRVLGGVLQIGAFGAQLQADHVLGGRDRLVGDLAFGRRRCRRLASRQYSSRAPHLSL